MTTIDRKRRFRAAAGSLLGALLLASCGGDSEGNLDPGSAADAPDYGTMIEAAPPKLRELYEGEGAGGLLDGGAKALARRIGALEGTPIVINKWASWCGPCRQEFPALQQQAAKRGDEVAFIGVNSADSVEVGS